MISARLLRNAFTSCDWLALFDISELLSVSGIRQRQLLGQVLGTLIALEQPPTSQAMQWLWVLSNGSAKPWTDGVRPTREAVRLDSLRIWISEKITDTIRPWHDSSEQSYEGFFGVESQEFLANRVPRIASLLLLALECRSSIVRDLGLDSTADTSEMAVEVERAMSDLGRDDGKLWGLLLLLLTRCRSLSAEMHTSLMTSVAEKENESEFGDGTFWHGRVVSWTPVLPEESKLELGLNTLCFPDMLLDDNWLHSQHGTLRPRAAVRLGSGQHTSQLADDDFATVQLDAQSESKNGLLGGKFIGHWQERGRMAPLPAWVYVLRDTGSTAPPTVGTTCAMTLPHLDTEASSIALFGVAGGADGGIIRGFHLEKFRRRPLHSKGVDALCGG